MNDTDIRLECLRMAQLRHPSGDIGQTVRDADALFQYVVYGRYDEAKAAA